jgi:hypothetical protein
MGRPYPTAAASRRKLLLLLGWQASKELHSW